MIKPEYHLKGHLFTIENNNKFILCFYSNPYIFRKNHENVETCNRNDSFDLCYGSLFNCHIKEKNKKILINFDEIRLILKKIFYYRKSAVEIFTEAKSYYFNFYEEKSLEEFMKLFLNKVKNMYYPIYNNNDLLGYIKLNEIFFRQIKLSKGINFVDIILNKLYNKEYPEISVFDALLLINLISNRSFLELNQYPVFPLLFFYDKSNNKVSRDLNNHIGFQEVTAESKLRKDILINSFNDYRVSLAESGDESKVYGKEHYFNVHYSNIVYITNYMIRFFPYSFLAIELQGDSFDDPNRLFFSIKNTFYNISTQKSDLRELIPEFFYLPEMFMNLNSFNFNDNSDKELVDDVIISNENKNENINLIINNNNVNGQNNNDIVDYFIFVDSMKKNLEKLKDNISSWLNIIFGVDQKNIIVKEGKIEFEAQYFRTEGYIDNITPEIYKNYSKDEIIMRSVEFGLVPLKTIFKKLFIHKRKSTHDKYLNKNLKEALLNNTKNKKNIINNEEKCVYEFNDNNEINPLYYRDNYNIKFEIDKINNMEKLKIYINEEFKCEIIDHNDTIIDVFYNSRLNMFATTSYDGLVCIYVFPNKLFSIIKHSKNSFFDKIFLSSNPFPHIITFEKNNNTIRSYSLSGLLFKEKRICEDKIDIELIPDFNSYKGTFKDRIKAIFKYKKEKYKIYNLPFFD